MFSYKSKASLASSRWNKSNRERINALARARYAVNSEKKKLAVKVWANKNKERVQQNHKAKRLANPVLYKALSTSSCRKYQASKLNRTPKWLSTEQLAQIKEFYTMAAELSWLSEGGLEVDHIVPLKGQNVSGLHVPWNLQILPASVNRSKGIKYGDR